MSARVNQSTAPWLAALVVLLGILLALSPTMAQDGVPAQYQKFFVHRSDSRDKFERALNVAGFTKQDVGRGFAVVAGVSEYPKLLGPDRQLEPAEQDMRKLVRYLKDQELFDEIVVLKNADMNFENLRYFLQVYFPDRVKENPKSRFFFAYSGHGITDGADGYLLESKATSMSDRAAAINLGQVKEFFDGIIRNGHQVLVMINACYAGAFLRRSFGGDGSTLPKLPGAHAILAGNTQERSWHDPKFGTGSVFWEKFIAGVGSGLADTLPVYDRTKRGDGIVTVQELATYLTEEVRIASYEKQNPKSGDITLNGSQGGFFFFNRERQVERGTIPRIEFNRAFGLTDQNNSKVDDPETMDFVFAIKPGRVTDASCLVEPVIYDTNAIRVLKKILTEPDRLSASVPINIEVSKRTYTQLFRMQYYGEAISRFSVAGTVKCTNGHYKCSNLLVTKGFVDGATLEATIENNACELREVKEDALNVLFTHLSRDKREAFKFTYKPVNFLIDR